MKLEEILNHIESSGLDKIAGSEKVIDRAKNGSKGEQQGFQYELLVAYTLISEGYSIIAMDTKFGKKEIDILAEKDGKKYAFDIKSSCWYRLSEPIMEEKKKNICSLLKYLNKEKRKGKFDSLIFVCAYPLPKNMESEISKFAEIRIIPYE